MNDLLFCSKYCKMTQRILSYMILYYILPSDVSATGRKQCTSYLDDTFDDCDRLGEPNALKNSNKNRIRTSLVSQNNSKDICINEHNCKKVYKLLRIKISFSLKTKVEISKMIQQCCGKCSKYKQTDISPPLSKANSSLIDTADIMFPITYQSSHIVESPGFHYLPVFEVPSSFYFTLRISKKEILKNLIHGVLKLWPLIIICLLMALIGGFIAWLLETCVNSGEFPDVFHIGWFEGFWWSLVTMTTVGYGDKCPRSSSGRIFAVFWILVGITVSSIYVGSITAVVMENQSSASPNLAGLHIGGLKHRMHDATIVAQHNGIFYAIDYKNTVNGIVKLFEKLERKEIDGFVISRPTFYYFARKIKIKDRRYKADALRMQRIQSNTKMLRSEIHFRDKLVTGMLINNEDVYKYFKGYLDRNWLHIQACYSYSLNMKEKFYKSEFNTSVEGLFFEFLVGSFCLLALIICFGVWYEIRSRRKKGKPNQTTDNQLL